MSLSMSSTMNTTFLGAEEIARVESIMTAFGIDGFDASIRLWGRGKAIEVDGNLGSQELACLLAIARYLHEPDPAEPRGATPINPALRTELPFLQAAA
ncbi:MAG: hypothetical protein ACT4PZ_16665 [Panacagrimonas sp.]